MGKEASVHIKFLDQKRRKRIYWNVECTEDSFIPQKEVGSEVCQGRWNRKGRWWREKEWFPIKLRLFLYCGHQGKCLFPVPTIWYCWQILPIGSSHKYQNYTWSQNTKLQMEKKLKAFYFKKRLNKICYLLLISCSNQQWISCVMTQNPKR